MDVFKIGDIVMYNNKLHKITEIFFNMINYYMLDNNVLCTQEELKKNRNVNIDVL